MCPCSMQNQRLFNSSEELYQRIQELRKILKMEKNSTNASLQKKISAPDSRPSSAGIGTIFGYGVIIGLVTLLVISDARILYRQLRFGTNWRPSRFCRISIKLNWGFCNILPFRKEYVWVLVRCTVLSKHLVYCHLLHYNIETILDFRIYWIYDGKFRIP